MLMNYLSIVHTSYKYIYVGIFNNYSLPLNTGYVHYTYIQAIDPPCICLTHFCQAQIQSMI